MRLDETSINNLEMFRNIYNEMYGSFMRRIENLTIYRHTKLELRKKLLLQGVKYTRRLVSVHMGLAGVRDVGNAVLDMGRKF